MLSASDLNSSFSQVFDNGEDLGWPATKAKDFDGQELILDSDADTSITADTDDQIDYRVGGRDVMRMTANGLGDEGIFAKNYIINGDFRVVQRGTSFTSATVPVNSDDTYLLDRWILLSDGNDIVDVTQGTDGSVGNGTYLQADVETTAKKFGFLTVLENLDVQDILSESDVVSLSFNALVSDAAKLSRIKAMVLSWTSTADAVTSDIVNAWGVEGTSPTVVANWTIEGDSGDLGVTASDVLYRLENVSINASGVNNLAVFIWSDDVATNDTLGTLLKITNIQLEPGAISTPYGSRPTGQELALCQRFTWVIEGTSDPMTMAQCITTTAGRGTFSYVVKMRTTPTLTVSAAGDFDLTTAGGTLEAVTALTLGSSNETNANLNITVGGNIVAGDAARLLFDAGGNGKLTFDAEL